MTDRKAWAAIDSDGNVVAAYTKQAYADIVAAEAQTRRSVPVRISTRMECVWNRPVPGENVFVNECFGHVLGNSPWLLHRFCPDCGAPVVIAESDK